MSGGFGQDDGFFQGAYDNQQQGYGMPYSDQQAGQGFGSFDYASQPAYDAQPQYNQSQQFSTAQPMYHGNILTPDQTASFVQKADGDEDDYENEPPLLEELGN